MRAHIVKHASRAHQIIGVDDKCMSRYRAGKDTESRKKHLQECKEEIWWLENELCSLETELAEWRALREELAAGDDEGGMEG